MMHCNNLRLTRVCDDILNLPIRSVLFLSDNFTFFDTRIQGDCLDRRLNAAEARVVLRYTQ